MLETNAAGRPVRLELAASAGLLTLHPDPDERELHGNVVTPHGVRHLAFDWSPAHELVVHDFPVVLLPAIRRLAGEMAGGGSTERPAVTVDRALLCRTGSVRLTRLADDRWRASSDGLDVDLAIDEDGAPAGLRDALGWPLEA